MKQVIVPPHSGVLSAYGLLVADHEQERVRAMPRALAGLDPAEIVAAFAALQAAATSALTAEGFAAARITIRRFADLRYVGQAFELTVPAEGADLAALTSAFHQSHLRTYAHMAEAEPVELVNLRVIAGVAVEAVPLSAPPPAPDQPAQMRSAYFGPAGLLPTAILRRADLLGRSVAGPAIVEEYDATCVIPPGCTAGLDIAGNIRITVN